MRPPISPSFGFFTEMLAPTRYAFRIIRAMPYASSLLTVAQHNSLHFPRSLMQPSPLIYPSRTHFCNLNGKSNTKGGTRLFPAPLPTLETRL